MTLQAAYNEYIVVQRIRGNSPQTVIYYGNCLLPFVGYFGKDTDPATLTIKHLQAYSLRLLDSGIASTSHKTYIKGIRAFLTWCYTEEYIPVDLSAKFPLPRASRKLPTVLTDEQIHAMFDALGSPKEFLPLRNHCICALMLDCGLRKGEVLSLTLISLHLSEGYILVNGKGNKQRIAPLGNHCLRLLMKYTAQRPSARSDALFLTADGHPIGEGCIRRMFRKVGKGHLTHGIHPHLLRHTFATRYIQNGGNPYALQLILGHTSLDMVKQYVHLTTAKSLVNNGCISLLDNLR